VLDLVQIGRDKEALLEELRAAGAAITDQAATGRSNFCCPYHGEKTPSAKIFEGEDGRWRFKCFACGLKGDILDLQALREGKNLTDLLHQMADQTNANVPRRVHTPRPTQNSTGPDRPAAQPQRQGRRYDDLETLKKAAIFADSEKLKHEHPEFDGRRVLARTFPYRHPDTGHMDLIVFRLEGNWEETEDKPKKKSILQAYQNADGKFELCRPQGLAPLFNRKGIKDVDTVIVVEGEGKVAALHLLGFAATCSPGGSNAAARADWSPLSGKKQVIIWRDKDKLNKRGRRPGLDYQNEVMSELKKLASPPMVKLVDVEAITELPEDGSDVVDYLKIHESLPIDERRVLIQGILDDAKTTGAHAELLAETEDILAGKRNVVDWPWPRLAEQTEALTAGMMTVICGAPGASKSLFMLQAALEWHKNGIPVALLQLEDGPSFHLRRAAAMLAGNSNLTSLKWQKEHPAETRSMLSNDLLTRFGQCLSALPKDHKPTIDNLLIWINEQVQKGMRIICIDPVTLADFGKDMHSEDSKLVRGIKNALEGSMASFVAVTHPRPGARTKTLDDMALTRDWGRHTQTAIWYDYLPRQQKFSMVTSSSSLGTVRADLWCNRVVHIKKSRNTGGQSKKIGFNFSSDTLMAEEIGEIIG
jgi:hypothetical protein